MAVKTFFWGFLFGFVACIQAGGPVYGKSTFQGLKPFGVAVNVKCVGTGTLAQHEALFAERIKQRLESRSIKVVPTGSVVLKLLLTNIKSEDGLYVVHMALQLHQSAYLAFNNTLAETPTWDAWKMGEYQEAELMKEVDDLVRQFANDYISLNQ